MNENSEALNMAHTLSLGTPSPKKTENLIPCNFRLIHNKTLNTYRLQGAFKWEQGFAGGIEWKNLETLTEE
ncbi:hypothetical protein UFOVP26_61 [uncultured Caudovirales phage]|uniref:Uncharacterized protein n=1 Tax=uncultured Caudovirales phage TaxID=2100421 RepID=A0A6J5KMU7_9CAUD|nr:hypothetical protein UFOVP26_61 [uncultured Caudovirales phage]CAB4123694.1 hypothetical protein UFOVP44_36 [uncultured Caudovirales phage]CAB5219048.1 hypothetical protein UFOVP220_27 [uncultured Caudovirales phage]